jgi:hypothetical protein
MIYGEDFVNYYVERVNLSDPPSLALDNSPVNTET